MFRRKIGLSTLVCVAQEALRQAIEVELGSRIEFTWLDIDPGKIRATDSCFDAATVTFKGGYSYTDRFIHRCDYQFHASIDLKQQGRRGWYPVNGMWVTHDSPEHTTSHELQWRNTSIPGVLSNVSVEEKSMRSRPFYNVGRGYAAHERWEELLPPRE